MMCFFCNALSFSHTFRFSLHFMVAELLAWGWGASCSVSWNAVDFLNPHQSILGLWGRAYLKPPFPRELRLESQSKQLADSHSLTLSRSPCLCVCWSQSAMEEEIADEDKDCSLGEGNELSDMPPVNEFTSFGGLGLYCLLSVIWLAVGKLCWRVKNRIGNTWDYCGSELEQGGGFGWWCRWRGLIMTHHHLVFLKHSACFLCLFVFFKISAGGNEWDKN